MSHTGARTSTEQVVAGLARRDGTHGRTDVDAAFDRARNRAPVTLRCDVAIVHPTAASYVHRAAARAGATAAAREARKNHRYKVACEPDKFYGTIVETGGRFYLRRLCCFAVVFGPHALTQARPRATTACQQLYSRRRSLHSLRGTTGTYRWAHGARYRLRCAAQPHEFARYRALPRSRHSARDASAFEDGQSALLTRILPTRSEMRGALTM